LSIGRDLSAVGRMLADVGARVGGARGEAERRDVLRLIFRINDAMGRIARTHRELRGPLAEVQLRLNAVTIAVKRGDFEEARLAMGRAEEAFADAKANGKFGKEFIERRGEKTD
jgi:hypothetical protein